MSVHQKKCQGCFSQDILSTFTLEIHKNKKSHDISANSCLDCIII